jgi:hypothetical protein
LIHRCRQALLDEEQKVQQMEGKVKEALRASASQVRSRAYLNAY